MMDFNPLFYLSLSAVTALHSFVTEELHLSLSFKRKPKHLKKMVYIRLGEKIANPPFCLIIFFNWIFIHFLNYNIWELQQKGNLLSLVGDNIGQQAHMAEHQGNRR